jgi:hypothetical protein
METLSSIFSSLKFKREKAFVGKEQKSSCVFEEAIDLDASSLENT